jgi:hypothetical protein
MDPAARTAPARAASPFNLAYWLDKIDPDKALPEADRIRRAEYAKKAWHRRNAYKALRARALAAEARRKAKQLDEQASAADAVLAAFKAKGQP